MAEDLSPSEIRARKFTVSRRGYDRDEVASFLDILAARIASLEGELDSIASRLNQLGIADLPLLKDEIDDVGAEVQAVLDAALQAAEGMRSRAGSDVELMLGDAETASYEL